MGFDVSDPGTSTQNRPFDGDDMYRCRQCQRWFNRSDALSVAEHRGAAAPSRAKSPNRVGR
jgi:hypothetical protein